MRMVVIGLVLLAGFKIWTQDRLYRSLMSDALIAAYRDRATEMCRKSSRRKPAASETIAPDPWGPASEAKVTIGNPDLDVAIWDTQNPLWDRRFQHPHLILIESRDASLRCSYDLRDGIALVAPHPSGLSLLP